MEEIECRAIISIIGRTLSFAKYSPIGNFCIIFNHCIRHPKSVVLIMFKTNSQMFVGAKNSCGAKRFEERMLGRIGRRSLRILAVPLS